MDVLSLSLSVIALFFSIVTFFVVFIREKRRDTVDAYMGIQDELYSFYEYKTDEIECFVTDRQSEEYKVLSTCLAKLEMFATGVRNKVYSFNVFYQLGHGYIDLTLRRNIEAVLEMKNSFGEETFYKNTIWLLSEMDKETQKKK